MLSIIPKHTIGLLRIEVDTDMPRFDWSGFAIILANELNKYGINFERTRDR